VVTLLLVSGLPRDASATHFQTFVDFGLKPFNDGCPGTTIRTQGTFPRGTASFTHSDYGGAGYDFWHVGIQLIRGLPLSDYAIYVGRVPVDAPQDCSYELLGYLQTNLTGAADWGGLWDRGFSSYSQIPSEKYFVLLAHIETGDDVLTLQTDQTYL
jgi:hypothetical protein